jgi:hypothetical protein
MALYGPPPNVSVGAGLHLIFTHYCSPWKSAIGTLPDSGERTLSMEGMNFARMCKEAPDLNKFIGRTDIDLIFSKMKPRGIRRREFDHFLDTYSPKFQGARAKPLFSLPVCECKTNGFTSDKPRNSVPDLWSLIVYNILLTAHIQVGSFHV